MNRCKAGVRNGNLQSTAIYLKFGANITSNEAKA